MLCSVHWKISSYFSVFYIKYAYKKGNDYLTLNIFSIGLNVFDTPLDLGDRK